MSTPAGPARCDNCHIAQVYHVYAPFCGLKCREEHFERMIEENDGEEDTGSYPWSKKDATRHG